MEAPNNLLLLFLSFSLLISAHFAQSDDLSYDPDLDYSSGLEFDLSPSPSPDSSSGTAPVASPTAGSPPAPSQTARSGPSPSPSPTPRAAEGPEAADGPDQSDYSDTLAPDADISPLVQQICDFTDYPFLCLATIVPRLNGDSNVPQVAEIALRTTADLVKTAQTLANSMAQNPEVSPKLASILNNCKDSYDTAVKNIDKAIEALPRRDVNTMRMQLSAVITNVGDCNDGYSGFGENSPFFNAADRLTNMTSNCLAIVSLMKD